jgi:hypothetical protein
LNSKEPLGSRLIWFVRKMKIEGSRYFSGS